MPKFLRDDKFPASIALILAIVGWAFLRIVDSLAAVPLLEYQIEQKKHGDHTSIILTVANLSGTESFTAPIIKVRRAKGPGDFGKVVGKCTSEIVQFPPADISGRGTASVSGDANGIEFPIQHLQPWGRLQLIACASDAIEASVAIQSTKPVVLRARGLLTLAVDNEIFILIAIVALGSVSIIWFGFTVGRRPARDKKQKAGRDTL